MAKNVYLSMISDIAASTQLLTPPDSELNEANNNNLILTAVLVVVVASREAPKSHSIPHMTRSLPPLQLNTINPRRVRMKGVLGHWEICTTFQGTAPRVDR